MSSSRKVMIVIGTRPEAIKMGPLCHALRNSQEFKVSLCVTAQHREMLDQALAAFELVPDIDLNLMRPEQDLSTLTAVTLTSMRAVFYDHRPDLVLLHGDTTTTMAAAMAAFYLGVPVGHVEAGLRTHNVFSPFPEEFNRQVVSRIARWHFAPTQLSKHNLLNEGVPPENVLVTGNTVIDALSWMCSRIECTPSLGAATAATLSARLPFDWCNTRFVLVTGHRRENFGEGFLQIGEGIRELATRYPLVHFVYPVHLNPNVQNPIMNLLGELDNVHLIEPLAYEPFVVLLKNCHIVLTDSGGIQEEAPNFGKPVLVMRDTTERPEALSAGTVRLVGASRHRIVEGVSNLLNDEELYRLMSLAHNPYGDGKACGRIVEALRKHDGE